MNINEIIKSLVAEGYSKETINKMLDEEITARAKETAEKEAAAKAKALHDEEVDTYFSFFWDIIETSEEMSLDAITHYLTAYLANTRYKDWTPDQMAQYQSLITDCINEAAKLINTNLFNDFATTIGIKDAKTSP